MQQREKEKAEATLGFAYYGISCLAMGLPGLILMVVLLCLENF